MPHENLIFIITEEVIQQLGNESLNGFEEIKDKITGKRMWIERKPRINPHSSNNNGLDADE